MAVNTEAILSSNGRYHKATTVGKDCKTTNVSLIKTDS